MWSIAVYHAAIFVLWMTALAALAGLVPDVPGLFEMMKRIACPTCPPDEKMLLSQRSKPNPGRSYGTVIGLEWLMAAGLFIALVALSAQGFLRLRRHHRRTDVERLVEKGAIRAGNYGSV